MAFGNCVVVNDTPANMEVIGDAGLAYAGRQGADGLRVVLEGLLARPDRVEEYRRLAAERAARYYSWDAVAAQYEGLFRDVASRGRTQR
jgi:glycosyltransferase involved in cell wall biosynthesis